MKSRRSSIVKLFFGILLIILALAIMIIPQFLNCYANGGELTLQNGKTVPMKCYWTAIAEITVAAPLLSVGIMMLVSRRKETLFSLSIVGIVLGLSVLALPTALIGVCASPMMLCHSVMYPLLLALGFLVILSNIGSLVCSLRLRDAKS
jgi:hypothetical protein